MSKKMTRYPSDRKVYVGDLGNNARKNDLEYIFGAYGTLRSVWIARNPPGFAFVEFEDSRDAADAVRALDGRHVCGRRARVELSTGKLSGRGGDRRRDRPRTGRFNGENSDKCYECGGRGHYARECRQRRRRSNSRSRSRSAYKSRSNSRSRSRSVSSGAAKGVTRKSRADTTRGGTKLRSENGSRRENGESSRYSDASSPSPKRRYDEDSPPSVKHRNVQTKHTRSTSRRGGGTSSRSQSNSRRD